MSRETLVGIAWGWAAGIAGAWWFIHRATKNKMPSPPPREQHPLGSFERFWDGS